MRFLNPVVIARAQMATLITVGSASTRCHTQRWEVRNFSQLPATVETKTHSPLFDAFDRKWRLSVCPGGWTDADKDYVSIFVELIDADQRPLRAGYDFTIINQAGERTSVPRLGANHIQFGPLKVEHPSYPVWGSFRLVGRTDLKDETKGFMLNDTVTFEVRLFSSMDGAAYSADAARSLSRTGAELLDSGMHTDVTLLVEGAEIAAHKALLAVRSPVFKAMFACKMRETLESRVVLEEIPLAAMHAFLRSVGPAHLLLFGLHRWLARSLLPADRFLYTGHLSSQSEQGKPGPSPRPGASSSSSSSLSSSSLSPHPVAAESKDAKASESESNEGSGDLMLSLLVVADRFQVPDLVALCAANLAVGLSADNLAERLVVADQCSQPALMARCLDFIRTDPARLAGVMDSDGWARLTPEQVERVLADLVIPAGVQHKGSKKRARPTDLAADPDMQQAGATKRG